VNDSLNDDERFFREGVKIEEVIYALMKYWSPRSRDDLSDATTALYKPAQDRFDGALERLVSDHKVLAIDDEDQVWLLVDDTEDAV
jgi:hypothetical protein